MRVNLNLFFIMFADKKIEIAEFEVNKDYGDDERIFRLNTPQGEVTLT